MRPSYGTDQTRIENSSASLTQVRDNVLNHNHNVLNPGVEPDNRGS